VNSILQENDRLFGNVLIPIDGSAASVSAVDEVIRLFTTQQPSLRLLHIADEISSNEHFEPGTGGWLIMESVRAEGEKILLDARNALAAHGLSAECRLIDSHTGRAARRIIREAAEWPADIIVMGTHGRRGIARWALGSTAEEVSRASPVPVLLVHAGVPVSVRVLKP
jgi:nucleotide-binding universal stress UspA family protein